jgi:hypothetical protein
MIVGLNISSVNQASKQLNSKQVQIVHGGLNSHSQALLG